MKSNWIPFNPANDPQKESGDLAKKIKELTDWYEDIASRREDDYIIAHLKLIINLIKSLENSEDKIFVEKITETFSEIIKNQREVIYELENELNSQESEYDMPRYDFTAPPSSLIYYRGDTGDFVNDDHIKNAFFDFMMREGKSTFTTNDYILRIQKLWDSLMGEYRAETLDGDLAALINEETISEGNPLLNAYRHIDALNLYVAQKIENDEGNRNWSNIRAALNTFGKALRGEDYKKVKANRQTNTVKDFSRYFFDGETFKKSRLVLAVVKRFVKDNRPRSFEELEAAFPAHLQGSFGVVKRIDEVPDKFKGIGGVKRYFINDDEVIRLSPDELVIVSSQWGPNIERFIEHTKDVLGYEIEKA